MISVEEAVERVRAHATPRPAGDVSLPGARGRVLGQDVACTMDSPPYDKSLVDGYAVRLADMRAGVELEVLEQITAGEVPTQEVTPGTATQIMTGAPLPPGADAVVMVEYTETWQVTGQRRRVRIQEHGFRAGQNIMRRGESMRQGDSVLKAGYRLRGVDIGLLAELGLWEVRVHPAVRVAIVSTGNELVPCDREPAAGQIRNSNGPMLRELVSESLGEPSDLGIARDNEQELEERIRAGLEYDVLLLSGGVSAGVLDLVPQVLARVGVREVFHKVHLRPGKPIWFGVTTAQRGHERLVFGLPGNPVSSLVCFHLFVRPAIMTLGGQEWHRQGWFEAVLAHEHFHRSDRPTYHPGRAVRHDREWRVEPLRWRGSADLRTFADANVLVYFPGEPRHWQAGEPVQAYWL
ncbi:MAG: gephyrin-like molybdotransferase Glp [Pirellulaceae bacterium]